MQICHESTLENVVDLLRKISKRDIQNGDQEIVSMKKNFLIAGEKISVLFSVFFLHFGCGISAYFIRFSHLFGL